MVRRKLLLILPCIGQLDIPHCGCSGQSHLPADNIDQEGTLIWLFTFEDSIHQRSAAALEALREGTWQGPGKHKQKLRVMMLTGDNEATANKVAMQLHIQDVSAGLSPHQ